MMDLLPNDNDKQDSILFCELLLQQPSHSYSMSISLFFKILFSHISLKSFWSSPNHEMERPALLCIEIAAVYLSTLTFSILQIYYFFMCLLLDQTHRGCIITGITLKQKSLFWLLLVLI